MRYRDVSLEEMTVLEHGIRAQRNALVGRTRLLSEVMRTMNHRAHKNLRHVDRELIILAAEVEGRAIEVFGQEAWDRAWCEHRRQCTDEKALTGQCVVEQSE